MRILGSPHNVDAAPNENKLIEFANESGKRAQKKREVFVSQVSKQLRQSDLLRRKAYYALVHTIDNDELQYCGNGRHEYF